MDSQALKEFFLFLKKDNWQIFGPKNGQDFGDKILIEEINDLDDLYLGPQLPFYSFKRFFVPEKEMLFKYRREELKSPLRLPPLQKEGEKSPLTPPKRGEQVAIFGMNLLDLKSVLLYDQVFEKDPYYQARRQNMLIVGHSIIPDVSQNIFEQTFEEDVLEHLGFDVFLGTLGNNSPPPPLILRGGENANEYAVFTGSQKGQKILEDFGYKDHIHIQFSGPVKEGKLDERMPKIRDKLKNHHNQKIWDELARRCIECGKCTIACPTCFCFRIDDVPSLESKEGQRQRCWDSCYYQEFSEVSGSHKFLSDTAARIHFWYYHKFARIPEEFNFIGCVGCRRCGAVCPVGIDIGEVLKEIENS